MKVMSNDLGHKLIRKLGIPGDVKKLDIQFEAGKPVTIEVEVEVTDRMGRVIDSIFEGYTVEKKDKEPEKEIVNALDAYDAEQRQKCLESYAPKDLPGANALHSYQKAAIARSKLDSIKAGTFRAAARSPDIEKYDEPDNFTEPEVKLDPAVFYTTPGVFIDQEHGIRVREKEGGELKSLEQTMIDAGLATPETLVRKILGPLTPCPIDSSHAPFELGTKCPECRKAKQYRLNNLI